MRIFKTSFGSMREDMVLTSQGQEGTYSYWEYSQHAVVVLPVRDNLLGLAPIFRYPLGSYSLEFPRGGIEEGENELVAAKRELLEELGLESKKVTKLGEIYPETALTDGFAKVFLIETDTDIKNNKPDDLEFIDEVHWLTLEEVEKAIVEGKIKCAITMATFSLYRSFTAKHR